MNKNSDSALIFCGTALAGAAIHGAMGDLWQAYWAAMPDWFAFSYAREVLK